MGKVTKSTKNVTGSKNELRHPNSSGPRSAYKNQGVEARNRGKRGRSKY